jgi:heme/copper-type cytochrome/quinol oxidase subunit 3
MKGSVLLPADLVDDGIDKMKEGMMESAANEGCETCGEAGKTGLWLFLASEVMLFAAFIAAYLSLRWGSGVCALGAPAWPKSGYTGGLALATANTVVLLTSSYTMVLALLGAREGNRRAFSRNMLFTILLGLAFLGIKAFEYRLKIHHGWYPDSGVMRANPGLNIFVSFYFAMTGLHALHMLAGLIWNGLLWTAGRGSDLDAGFSLKVEYAGLYWHFVDIVWVFIFPLFYLI